MDAVRNDPRLGTNNLNEERLQKVLNTNPAIKSLQEQILAIEDELATLRREGLLRLLRASQSREEEHPLRRAASEGDGNPGLRAVLSRAAAGRRFLNDGELQEVEGLVGAAVGAEGARIRRVAASLLRDFSQTILEAAKEPVRTVPPVPRPPVWSPLRYLGDGVGGRSRHPRRLHHRRSCAPTGLQRAARTACPHPRAGECIEQHRLRCASIQPAAGARVP